jgi:peptide/nickel transport system ATP-binding protein
LDVLLETRNLIKYFPIKKSFRQLFKSGGRGGEGKQPDLVVKAVDDVSFILERGKVLVVAGASGSGKTTVARRM